MSAGQKQPKESTKVSTWAKPDTNLGNLPGDLSQMRVEFFGVSAEAYPEALADAVFEFEVELETGGWVH